MSTTCLTSKHTCKSWSSPSAEVGTTMCLCFLCFKTGHILGVSLYALGGVLAIGWDRHLTGEELLWGFSKVNNSFVLFPWGHTGKSMKGGTATRATVWDPRWSHKGSSCSLGLQGGERITLENDVYAWNTDGGTSLWWVPKAATSTVAAHTPTVCTGPRFLLLPHRPCLVLMALRLPSMAPYKSDSMDASVPSAPWHQSSCPDTVCLTDRTLVTSLLLVYKSVWVGDSSCDFMAGAGMFIPGDTRFLEVIWS